MDMIELARELGREIQKDQRFLDVQVARQQSDEDEGLQKAIGEFNLKRMSINNEAQKPERDEEKLQKLNDELRTVYAEIMQNGNMTGYNTAKSELDALVQRVTAIVTLCADGENPDTCDYDAASCGGDCGSCGGCH